MRVLDLSGIRPPIADVTSIICLTTGKPLHQSIKPIQKSVKGWGVGLEFQKMNIESGIDILSQVNGRREVDEIGRGEWTTVYARQAGNLTEKSYYSCFIPKLMLKSAISHDSWDLSIGDGLPGFSQWRGKSRTVTKYHRFGRHDNIEPIVYIRSWSDLKPRQIEILEEFRHYHDLYHDRLNDRYIKIDERGEDEIVGEVYPDFVRIKTRHLRQFAAARRFFVAIFFDFTSKTKIPINEVKKAMNDEKLRKNYLCYSFYTGESLSGFSFSRLVGKKIVAPISIKKCGVWPYDSDNRKFVEYIIEHDAEGEEVLYTCDPDKLRNYFGKNPEAPHYLTPVWFKREVLQKYYSNSEKYLIEDGCIRCGSLWSLQIDNDLSDHIVVYLGDLGQSLTHNEQLYWKSFNVTSEGRSPSKTNISRSFLAQFTDPNAADLVFKSKLVLFQETWERHHGWQIFRQLHNDDAHATRQLRIPMTDGYAEFDQQIILLTKLLIDSLNDAEILKNVGSIGSVDEKSIGKFQRYLVKHEYPFAERDIGLLRSIQNLRSAGAAHRRGSQYQKLIKIFDLDKKTKADVFRELLIKCNRMLDDLDGHFIQPPAT